MRILILIAVLHSFSVGGFADMAHAFAADHICAHHHMDYDDNAHDEPCHSEQDQSQCDGCCCIHSHSMATSVTPIEIALNVSKQNTIVSADNYYSYEFSGLKRPPRLQC